MPIPGGKWAQSSTGWHNLQLAGRVSLTGKSSGTFFFLSPSCLKQVKAGPLHLLPSLCCSLWAPPGSLVLQHYNYLFCCLHVHMHSSIAVVGGEWEGGEQGTCCSDSAAWFSYVGHAAWHIPPHERENKHRFSNRTRMSCGTGNLIKHWNSTTTSGHFRTALLSQLQITV